MNSITLPAPAKINLYLHIIEKRSDGYHNIQTLFQKISLADELTLGITSKPGITVSCDDPTVPDDSRNLAYRAADMLLKDRQISTGISIEITKRIPAGAGLGGGSSDAASTLLGLSRLLHLNVTHQELQNLAGRLGADVPFFLSGAGSARASGIGEILNPLDLNLPNWFLLIFPQIAVSTARAYKIFSDKMLTKSKKNTILPEFIDAPFNPLTHLYNDFEGILLPAYPAINNIKEDLLKAGASGALLCGSGSSVFGIFPTRDECRNALKRLSLPPDYKTFVVHCL